MAGPGKAEFEIPSLREAAEIPPVAADAMAHSKPFVAKPEHQEPLGFPGELVDDWKELRAELPGKTLPRAVGSPVKEIIAAVKGEIGKCGSNFDYAVPLTETVILGTIAIRSGRKVEYDPETMTCGDSSLNAYIKEPVRGGWECGEGILEQG